MPDHCFCEAIRDGWIRQPANAISALMFVVVAAAIAWHARKHDRNASAVLYVFALLCIGLGSAFYHASLTFVGQFADVFGMYLLGSFILLYPIARRWNLPGLSLAILYVALNGALAYVLIYHPALRRYLFGALIIPALVLEVMPSRHATTPRDSRPLILSATLLGVAFVIWSLDITRVLCRPGAPLQGHAVWHVLGAFSAAALYVYYRSVKPKEVIPLQSQSPSL